MLNQTLSNGDASIIPQRPVEFYSNGTDVDRWLFHQSIAITFFGVGVPAIACVGFVANLFTFSAYQHPDFRSLSTLFLNANLITDSVLLVSCSSIVAPKYWLHQFYQNLDKSHFWRALSAAQKTHIVAFPVFLITKCLSQWYTMAIIIEQWFAFAKPGKLTRMNSREQGHKMVVFIMNITIIIHFIVFFKYTRRKVFIWQEVPVSGNATTLIKIAAEEICLSAIYRSDNYQRYEKYIYFIFFEFIPCLITLFFLILCLIEHQRLKQELLSNPIPNIKLLRTFRSGRSVRTVLSIGCVFFCLQMSAHINYLLTLEKLELDTMSENCHLTPTMRAFSHKAQPFGVIYIYMNIINAAIKPWICISLSYDFQHLLHSCWEWGSRLCRSSRMVPFDHRRASFPVIEETSLSSTDCHDDTHSTTSTNYFDAISYSTVGTPMLIHQDFPRSRPYDDLFDLEPPIEMDQYPRNYRQYQYY